MLYTNSDRMRERQVQDSNDESWRNPWRRDYARLIHSAAFRRLQGKTQLFPGFESDFFRNRLTHSLEVAQIAKSIALRLNHLEFSKESDDGQISCDLVETAALAHDLGHPPFGHNGELALDKCMLQHGGFEGNAQTLRILSRIEKKSTKDFPPPKKDAKGRNYYLHPPKPIDNHRDCRLGLNLTYRTLASILKYDKPIPEKRSEQVDGKVTKGYYYTEKSLVEQIKRHVLNDKYCARPFKTLECSIMDLADDIAYSTYDLEDAFKGGFLSPIQIFSKNDQPQLLEDIAKKVNNSIESCLAQEDVREILESLFADKFKELLPKQISSGDTSAIEIAKIVADCSKASNNIASSGYIRTDFTSELVGKFVNSVELKRTDDTFPCLYSAELNPTALKQVEVLKHLTYCALTRSPRLRIAEYRGREIVRTIFEIVSDSPELLPEDFKENYAHSDASEQPRVICDFIAGMTDAYAVDFYARLKSENAKTIFRPY